MEEDDDELAQLRAARRARLGAAGATLSERRQGGAAPSHDSYFEEEENPRRDGNGRQERAGDEAEDGGLRAMLPMSFGGEKLRGKPVTAEDGDDPSSRAGSTGRAAAVPTSYGPPRPETLPKEAGEQRAEEEDEDSEEVGPRAPDAAAGGEADKGEDEGSDEEDDVRGSGGGGEGGGMGSSSAAEADPYHLPVTQEVELAGHSKVVAALDIDRTGSRLVTGGLDYQVRLYDFNGMKSDLKPFRDLEPSSGYPVLGLSWSPSGDAFLCVMGSTQAKLYDRDGRELGEFPRGDMYIRDMKNTKGHVASCRGGQWHPNDKTQVMTCSEDGTVRLWDAHQLTQRTVLKPKPGRKVQRTHVTSCCYNSDGRVVAAGLNDGSIQLWTVSGGRIGRSAAVGVVLPPKPQMIEKQRWTCKSEVETVVAKAHAPGGDITSLAFSRDNNLLLSRAEDSLKLWDLRNAQRGCVHEWTDLPLLQSSTACGFSPDESLLLTGTCADRSGVGGAVWFFDRARLSLVRKVAVPGSAVALKWHAGLNQILVGAGTNSAGGCRVLYDPVFSVNGALRCVGRKPRAKNPLDFEAPPVIHNPHALPLFREDPGRKRRRELDRKDPAVSRQPDPGDSLAGPGKGGRLGTTKKTLLTQHIMAKQGKLVSVEQEMDPRVALLRHADKTDEFSTYLTGAYGDTQPKKIFAEDEEDEEQPSGDAQK